MLNSFAEVVDFTASLALIAVLAEGYGVFYRRLGGSWIAPVALGILFGLVALAQMSQPIEPIEGLIVDLRNIPIALAGAFLGLRGLLPAIAIAAAARFQIGGMGMEAGLIGIVIAGSAGLLWARIQRVSQLPPLPALVLLACIASTHLLAGLVMPPEAQAWFYTNAAGPMLLINLIAIPLVAMPLKRQKYQMIVEHRLVASAGYDVDSGLLSGSAFLHQLGSSVAAQPLGTYRGFLVIRLRNAGWSVRTKDQSHLGVVAHLVRERLPSVDIAALTGDCRIVVPLSDSDLASGEAILSDLRRALYGTWFDGYDGWKVRLSADMAICADPDPARLFAEARRLVLGSSGEGLDRSRRRLSLARREAPAGPPPRQILSAATAGILFAKADLLLGTEGS